MTIDLKNMKDRDRVFSKFNKEQKKCLSLFKISSHL